MKNIKKFLAYVLVIQVVNLNHMAFSQQELIDLISKKNTANNKALEKLKKNKTNKTKLKTDIPNIVTTNVNSKPDSEQIGKKTKSKKDKEKTRGEEKKTVKKKRKVDNANTTGFPNVDLAKKENTKVEENRGNNESQSTTNVLSDTETVKTEILQPKKEQSEENKLSKTISEFNTSTADIISKLGSQEGKVNDISEKLKVFNNKIEHLTEKQSNVDEKTSTINDNTEKIVEKLNKQQEMFENFSKNINEFQNQIKEINENINVLQEKSLTNQRNSKVEPAETKESQEMKDLEMDSDKVKNSSEINNLENDSDSLFDLISDDKSLKKNKSKTHIVTKNDLQEIYKLAQTNPEAILKQNGKIKNLLNSNVISKNDKSLIQKSIKLGQQVKNNEISTKEANSTLNKVIKDSYEKDDKNQSVAENTLDTTLGDNPFEDLEENIDLNLDIDGESGKNPYFDNTDDFSDKNDEEIIKSLEGKNVEKVGEKNNLPEINDESADKFFNTFSEGEDTVFLDEKDISNLDDFDNSKKDNKKKASKPLSKAEKCTVKLTVQDNDGKNVKTCAEELVGKTLKVLDDDFVNEF